MTSPPPPRQTAAPSTVLVWDRPVRLLHGALALSVALAWWTDEATLALHETAGYAALAVVAVRVAWGFAARSRFARFGDFVCGPGTTWRYLRSLRQPDPPRHLGHNPLGGWMTVALLLAVAATGVSGWLFTLDRFWGMAWLEWLHRACAWIVLALVGMHLAGVAFTSWRQRENLAAAMVTGLKRQAPPAVDRKAP